MTAIEKYVLEHIVGSNTGHTIESFIDQGYKDAVNALLKGDFAGFLSALPESVRTGVVAEAVKLEGEIAGKV